MAFTRRPGARPYSRRLPRHLRNEDIPRDTFTHRTYQVELLESAAGRNTVVCMGSSSGRMFIAVMLMKEMAEQVRPAVSAGGKQTVILLNTDDDVEALSPSVQHALDIHVKSYTEKMGVKQMTSQQWKEELEMCEAMILTGSVFLDVLKAGFISLDIINLLIFNDCHLVLQDHPYKHIMDIYTTTEPSAQPRILGLTSNILDMNMKTPECLGSFIDSLEEALQSVAETSSLVIPNRYGIKPNERVIECADYEDSTGLNDKLYELLENSIDFLDECNIEINEDLDNRDPRLIPKAALIECHNILTMLGPWCAACLADMLVTQIEKIEKQKEFVAMHKKFLKLGATTLRMVSKIFEEHFKYCEYSLEDLLSYSTPKVAELMKCLQNYRPKTDFVIISEDLDPGSDDHESDSEMSDYSDFSDNENDNDDITSPNSKQIHIAIKKVGPEDDNPSDPFPQEDKCLSGIVFIEHQHAAYALNKYIEEACAWDESLCFVKSTHVTGSKSSNKKQGLFKKQEDTLRKFRMQELNLLVSTNFLEDGVDLPKCNLVVRFDLPKSYKSYSHSKGRAKARDAEYVILVEEEHFDEFETELKTYHDIENVLIRKNLEKSEPEENHEVNSDLDNVVEPYNPSGEENGVCATTENAIMLINRYCANLPSDAFTHLTPSCTIEEHQQGETTLFVASIRLPINSPYKSKLQGPPMSTKLKAKQAVALKLCQILHKKGELDENLMPVGKEMFEAEEDQIWEEEDDTMGEARPGTTKRKQYYYKKIAGALLQSEPGANIECYVYVIDLNLTGPITEDQNTRGRKIYAPEETSQCFGILTSKLIPVVPTFPVFTRSGEVTVSVDMLERELTLSPVELDKLKTFHRFLFSNVLRLEKDPMSYQPDQGTMGYLVVPLECNADRSVLEVDWKFTDKVVESSNQPPQTLNESFEFEFQAEDFEDAVVMPSYRNIDQPQYFYVAEIRFDLNPVSPFPSPELYKTFAEYYASKYGLAISNLEQPLLDVDHTSARLNLLIPRYMNQKGVPLPTSSAETKKARRENLQQKQILVPELCDVHVFPASLWRKAVCLPAILYRLNYLLLSEEIRKHVAREANIGIVELPKGHRFPKLDFGIDTSPENLKLLAEKEKESASDDDDDLEEKPDINDESIDEDNSADMPEKDLDNGLPESIKELKISSDSKIENEDTVNEIFKDTNNIKQANKCTCDINNIKCKESNANGNFEIKTEGDKKSVNNIFATNGFIESHVAKLEENEGKKEVLLNETRHLNETHQTTENGDRSEQSVVENNTETDDIFSNVGKFVADTEKDKAVNEDLYPEPLTSLDVDMDISAFIGPSPCEILQALTMSNANDFFSLERLETIGDSFLKYAVTVYLYCSYPGIHEGKLSYLRSKQVSNYNLYRLGKKKGLAECMISTKFEPYENWLPPGYIINEDKRKGPVPRVHLAPETSLNKLTFGLDNKQAEGCDKKAGKKLKLTKQDAQSDNFQSELDEADQISRAKDEEFEQGDKLRNLQNFVPYNLQIHHCLADKSIADCVEALIGCYLTSCDKIAALRFMSWMGLKVLTTESGQIQHCPESPFSGSGESDNQLLERLLDGYSVFEERIGYTFKDRSYLLQAFTHASYHINTITDCYQRLEFLGDAVLDYVITRHLYEDSDRYSPGVLTDLRSALVNNNIFAALAVKWDFHKYFKAMSPPLFNVIEKFVLRQKEKEDEIDAEDDETDEDQEKEHLELEVPKALGDIFESIAGAIYLDSGMSLDAVWRVFYRIMKPQIDKYLKNIPKSPVRELLEQEPETAKFEKPERTMDGKIRVTVNVVGKGVYTGVGRNYRIAKSAAAKKALRCIKTLEQQGLV